MDMFYRIFVSTILRFILILILIIGADAQLTVHTPTDLSVREGENVTLVCTYEPRTEPALFHSITWLRAESVLAFTCSDSCSETDTNTDRYTLDFDAGFSGNLTIYGITLEDDSVYRCIVTTTDGYASGELLRLRVNAPPVNLKLSDTMTPGGYKEGDIVPVLSGQSYTVNCSTQPGANPAAVLEWTSTTAHITQGVQDDQAVTGSRLTMSSWEVTFTPTMADHLTSVTCEATHPALDTSLTKFIQLDVQVPPSNVNISFNSAMILNGETLTLQEGTPSIITCESLGTQPASTITWYLDGVPVTSGISTPVCSPNAGDSRLSDASSSIIIQPTRENHEQVLRCQAETFGISQDTSIRLSVDGPPDPPVITGTPDNLIENQQTSVSCQADNGHPPPSFQWFIGNRNLTGDATLQLSTGINNRTDATSQLRYLPLREDNGRALQCNVIHDELSQPLKVLSDTLTVNFPSTIRNKDDNTELALEGENATFICEAEGKPSPSITWQQLLNQSDELDNGILVTQSEQKTVYRSLVTSTLIIAEVIPEMYHTTFSCIANNSHGTDRKNFHLKKPDPDSQNKLAPALIGVASTVILMILIFVMIRWWLSWKNKQARERGKIKHISSPSSSSVQKEEKPYVELSSMRKEIQREDYLPLHPYETPMELADRSLRGAPDSTLGGGVTARANMEHTYADAEEKSHEDIEEHDYINNTVLIPRGIRDSTKKY